VHNTNIAQINDNMDYSFINKLQLKIKKLENENKNIQIQTLENIKNEEINLMTQKIKNLEIIIDENSFNFVKEISQLKLQISNYKVQMLHYEKYVDIVNFFISKIHLILELNLNSSKDNINKNLIGSINDINELRNVLIQIENFINSIIHNNNNN
jgi:hypothetical protein